MKTIGTILISLGIFTGSTRAVSACSLMPQPISASLSNYPNRIVAFGTVTKVEVQYSEFKLLEIFDGSGSPQEVIRIWDEKDWECNGPFKLGSEQLGAVGDSVLLIAPKIMEAKNPWDVIGDYRMPFFYATRCVSNFTTGTVYYNNDRGGVPPRLYTSAEMKELMKKYLLPSAIHRPAILRKKALRIPGGAYRNRDLKGRREL